jgi:hypothetical protein
MHDVSDSGWVLAAVFDSGDAADAMSGQATVSSAMTFRDVEVREVAAHA